MCNRFLRFLEHNFACFSRTNEDEDSSEDQTTRGESRRSSRAGSDKEESSFQSYSDEDTAGEDVVECHGRSNSQHSSFEDFSSITMGSISSIPNATNHNRSHLHTTQSEYANQGQHRAGSAKHLSRSKTKRQNLSEPTDQSEDEWQARDEEKRRANQETPVKKISKTRLHDVEKVKHSNKRTEQHENHETPNRHTAKKEMKNEETSTLQHSPKKLISNREAKENSEWRSSSVRRKKMSNSLGEEKPVLPNKGTKGRMERKKMSTLERKATLPKAKAAGKLVRFKASHNSSKKCSAPSRGSVKLKKNSVTKSEPKTPPATVGIKRNPTGKNLGDGQSVFAKGKTKPNSRGPSTLTAKSMPKRMSSRSFKSRPVGIMKKR